MLVLEFFGRPILDTSTKLLHSREFRRALRLAIDVAASTLSFVAAMSFRLGAAAFRPVDVFLANSLLFAAVSALVFVLCGLPRQSWRFASIPDLVFLMRAIAIAVASFTVCDFILLRLDPIPRTVPLIAFFIMLTTMSGVRIFYRGVIDGSLPIRFDRRHNQERKDLLVYGATPQTDAFLRSLRSAERSELRVVGIIEDDVRLIDRSTHGVRVLGRCADLQTILGKLAIRGCHPTSMIVPAGSLSRERLQEVVSAAARCGLRTSRLPPTSELLEKASGPFAFEPLQITDLLGRPPVALELESIKALVRGKSVVVTGGGGSIGSELCRQLLARSPGRLVIIDHSELNLFNIGQELAAFDKDRVIKPILASVRDAERIREIFEDVQVDLVFHAAAYKHVPLVEANPLEGVITNVVGTANVADAAVAVGAAAMIMVSTDKAVQPANIMGLTKRVAETYCQALDFECAQTTKATRFMVVRFGNVLGSSGSVVPVFERQIRCGGPLTVTHPEMTRYFMTIPEAVELVLQGSAFGMLKPHWRGAILVLDMGEPVPIVDLARRMIMLAGLVPESDIPIDYIGLRPGEKLHEELFDKGELLERTDVPGIRLARSAIQDMQCMRDLRDALSDLSTRAGADVIRQMLYNVLQKKREEATLSAALAIKKPAFARVAPRTRAQHSNRGHSAYKVAD